MKLKVGFIGVGAMGTPMVCNLIKAGYAVIIYDIRKEAMEALALEGVEQASSPKDVARQCPVVITMLPSSAEVEATVLGPDGVIEGVTPSSILIDMSSSYTYSTRMLSKKLAKKGARMLDAPVSGGVRGAREGTLAIMVGGDEKVLKECRSILEAMGSKITHVGNIGAGHAVKCLNNMCSACTMIITSEALVAAAKLGLNPELVLAAINNSSGRSYSSEYKFPTFVLNGAFNSGFTVSLMHKDVGMAVRLGEELHVPMFLGTIVQQVYNYAVAKGGSDMCHTSIVKFIEECCGVKVRGQKYSKKKGVANHDRHRKADLH